MTDKFMFDTYDASHLSIDVLYADEHCVVVYKPAGLLSVPGKGPEKADCVVSRVREMFPGCIEHPEAHRLDMSTSGILILGLTIEAKRDLSTEFRERRVGKKYEAILDGEVRGDSGTIDLPLRLDWFNSPIRIYDPLQGKRCLTLWEKLDYSDGQTRIAFDLITGRTHQLRVHSSHKFGLGCPIVGDNLYGTRKPGERLMLHSRYLKIAHPVSGETLEFDRAPDF